MLLWKAADRSEPPLECKDITSFGWTVEDTKVTPTVASGPIAPEGLLDIVSCDCSAEGKACKFLKCGCYKENISCTGLCKCKRTGLTCHNPYSKQVNPVRLHAEDSGDD